jgi:hypothetical protein
MLTLLVVESTLADAESKACSLLLAAAALRKSPELLTTTDATAAVY